MPESVKSEFIETVIQASNMPLEASACPNQLTSSFLL